MTETYSTGTWVVKTARTRHSIDAWTDFVIWASAMPGSGTFRLVRDVDNPSHYLSFAPWESFEAQQAWKDLPEFRERIGRVRAHCEDSSPRSSSSSPGSGSTD